jgi:large subunit ribosomal protein L29
MSKTNQLVKTLRNMSLTELENELLTIRKTQFNLRMKTVNGVLQNAHHITEARKKIARIKTLMTEKAGNSHVE